MSCCRQHLPLPCGGRGGIWRHDEETIGGWWVAQECHLEPNCSLNVSGRGTSVGMPSPYPQPPIGGAAAEEGGEQGR